MTRRILALAALVALAGCSLDKQAMPSLAGPSELGLSLAMTATPDIITQDGASRATIEIVARDGRQPAGRGLWLRLETAVGSVVADVGTLSARTDLRPTTTVAPRRSTGAATAAAHRGLRHRHRHHRDAGGHQLQSTIARDGQPAPGAAGRPRAAERRAESRLLLLPVVAQDRRRRGLRRLGIDRRRGNRFVCVELRRRRQWIRPARDARLLAARHIPGHVDGDRRRGAAATLQRRRRSRSPPTPHRPRRSRSRRHRAHRVRGELQRGAVDGGARTRNRPATSGTSATAHRTPVASRPSTRTRSRARTRSHLW